MNGVCKRVALTFSNRQFRRNVEHSGDRNWLQIDVGVAFKMIQDFWKLLIYKIIMWLHMHLSEMAGAILYPKQKV